MTALRDITPSQSWAGRIDRSGGPDACWLWTGRLTVNGYGGSRVKEAGVWRTAGAHQIAHYLATGQWEAKADGRLVRHLCHNRRCCNPAHLSGGTRLDNAFDRAARVEGRALVHVAVGPAASLPSLRLPVVGIAR